MHPNDIKHHARVKARVNAFKHERLSKGGVRLATIPIGAEFTQSRAGDPGVKLPIRCTVVRHSKSRRVVYVLSEFRHDSNPAEHSLDPDRIVYPV